MKRKILVPMFTSVMALSMNIVANADNVEKKDTESKEDSKTLKLDEYKEVAYKTAVVKDGVAVKIREQGNVEKVAYSGEEFKVIAIQGEWAEVALEDGQGWIATRYIDIKEARGYITSDKVNLRKEPNVDSEVIEELELGSTVKVVEDQGNWLKVQKGEEEGYIRSLYVDEEAPVIEVEEVVATSSTESRNNVNTSSSNSSNKTNSSSTKKPSQSTNKNNSTSSVPSANKGSVQSVLNLAYSKMGCPYVWGAEGPNSFDCSGFTSYVFRNAAGVSLPRTSSAQSGYGRTVSKSNLQPGDLVFFNTSGGGVSHVGIYVGGGNMIHSPSTGKTVSVTSINSSYYSSRFVTAKRVL